MIFFITFHSQMDLIVVFKHTIISNGLMKYSYDNPYSNISLKYYLFLKWVKIHIKYVRTTIIYLDNHIGCLKSTRFRKSNLVVNTSIWVFYCFHITCCNRHLPLMFHVIPIWWMTDQVWVSNYMNKTYMWVFQYRFKGETKGMTWKIFEYYVWKY
jgi:hypothetical protein